MGPGRASYVEPEVRLADIEITSKAVNSDSSFERTKRAVEVQVFSEEELAAFGDLSTEYLSYKRRLWMDSTNQVLQTEARRLRDAIIRAYGEDAWFLADL